jgi:hypothetical protein
MALSAGHTLPVPICGPAIAYECKAVHRGDVVLPVGDAQTRSAEKCKSSAIGTSQSSGAGNLKSEEIRLSFQGTAIMIGAWQSRLTNLRCLGARTIMGRWFTREDEPEAVTS